MFKQGGVGYTGIPGRNGKDGTPVSTAITSMMSLLKYRINCFFVITICMENKKNTSLQSSNDKEKR